MYLLFSYSEIPDNQMKQAEINFFGPLIAVVVLITSALLGFVILKKNGNILSTNQSKLLPVIQLTGFTLHNHPFIYFQAADRKLGFMLDLS